MKCAASYGEKFSKYYPPLYFPATALTIPCRTHHAQSVRRRSGNSAHRPANATSAPCPARTSSSGGKPRC